MYLPLVPGGVYLPLVWGVPAGGCTCQGGVPASGPRGVGVPARGYLPLVPGGVPARGEGVPASGRGTPAQVLPLREQNDRQVQKYYLALALR